MQRTLSTALALVLATLSVPSVVVARESAGPADVTTQLPRTVRPVHYDVEVTPNSQALTFAGKATITLEVVEPTAVITLNALDMAFASARLTPLPGGAAPALHGISIDPAGQTASFAFAQPLGPGSYQLALDYTGRIGTQASGIFAIDYDTARGRKRALYTQFENSDARRFVPSWDEPNHKATFTLAATVPSGQMAVSNMPVVGTTDLGDGIKRVRFAASPKMSTYLLFFALGDFERATAMAGDTEVGVITQAGKIDQARFALDSSVQVLKEYNDYFGTPYPLPKLDNIGSPGRSQFFGAMENWGAIFSFEHILLLDPAISTEDDRQDIYQVAAHEIAHQWFGNLVTMQWWDDLWLNEGFATWMAGRTTQKLHPEWNTRLQTVASRNRAMSLDAVETTHPVVQHVETVEQASQAFDAITYQKGGAVIRMLEGYVGEDAWREGVRRYMKKYAYANTASDDLWREIGAAAGQPITQIAHDFTLQPGVPLIRVESAVCRKGTTRLTLSQGEFTKDRPGKQPLTWRMPVIAQALGSANSARTLVTGGKGALDVPGCGPVVVNAGQSGYYRTLYAPAQFAQLRQQFAQVPAIDQIGLLTDTWAQGMAGLQPATDYLELVTATPVDADPQVWSSIAGALAELDALHAGDVQRRQRFRGFATDRLTPVLARLGWEARVGEPASAAIVRARLIETLGRMEEPGVVAEARRRHQMLSTDPSAVPGELRSTILAVVAHNADAATWDALHAAAGTETTPLVKDRLYLLLSSTRDADLARRALELALTDEPGATNSAAMVRTVSQLHPELALDLALAHQQLLDGKVDAQSRSRYYPRLALASLEATTIDKLRAYAEAHVAPGSRRETETAVANIEYRRKVREQRLPAIDAWLAKGG